MSIPSEDPCIAIFTTCEFVSSSPLIVKGLYDLKMEKEMLGFLQSRVKADFKITKDGIAALEEMDVSE